MPRVWNYTRTQNVEIDESLCHQPTTVEELGTLLGTAPQGTTFTLRSAGQAFDSQALPVRATPASEGANATGRVVFLRAMRNPPEAPELTFRANDPEGRFQGWVPGPEIGWAEVDPPTLEVAGWVTWGAVFDRLLREGCLPYVHVTSRRVSVAGSINADGLSRSSPLVGKEAGTLVWVQILAPRPSDATGKPYTLLRVWHPRSWAQRSLAALPAGVEPPADEATNQRWFEAIVGGLGLLGVITRAKYLVMPVDRSHKGTAFQGDDAGFQADPGAYVLRAFTRTALTTSFADTFRDLADLAGRLPKPPQPVPHTRTLPVVWNKWNRVTMATTFTNFPRGHKPANPEKPRAALMTTSFAWTRRELQRFVLWRRRHASNIYTLLLPLVKLSPTSGDGYLWKKLVRAADHTAPAGKGPFIDAICAYSFFFEAHSAARDRLEPMYSPVSVQQTYSIPIRPAVGEQEPNAGLVSEFYERARKILHDNKAEPQATDILALPASEGFLSANRDLPALAVSFAFEGARGKRQTRIKKALREISAAARGLGGRVHFGKNVEVDDDDLAAMYHGGLQAFAAVKQELDPRGVLSSAFWEERLAPLVGTNVPLAIRIPDAKGPRNPVLAGWDPVASSPEPVAFFGAAAPLVPNAPPPRLPRRGKRPTDLEDQPSPCAEDDAILDGVDPLQDIDDDAFGNDLDE